MNFESRMNFSILYFIILSAFISQKSVHGFTEDESQLIKDIREKCTTETGATVDMIEDARKGNFEEEDEKLECYFKCIWVTMEVMNEDGEFVDESEVQALLPSTVRDDFLTSYGNCKEATGSNACEKAYAMSKCIRESNPNAFFLP